MAAIPEEVREQLLQEIDRARAQIREGDADAASATVRRIAGIASEELPADDRAEQLLHGCEEVEYHAAEDPGVAVEYLRAMRDRVADGGVSE
ncbi:MULTISPECIES: hypothetical protein [unclassified Haloparvum]|uniref:hypothetical protein n=1 Tax=Haloparvum sp. PAK95 TaxID=3418962 RepID=UPI003D2EA9E2